MTQEFIEIAIITGAFSVTLGYAIGIIKHLADYGWRFDSIEWF